jgi:hypothetical protein
LLAFIPTSTHFKEFEVEAQLIDLPAEAAVGPMVTEMYGI